jgi:hypothetical protein
MESVEVNFHVPSPAGFTLVQITIRFVKENKAEHLLA